MKPETAAAIARRIGMVESGRGFKENDPEADASSHFMDERNPTISVGRLPAYLATGDRPLRVMEAMERGLAEVGLSATSEGWKCRYLPYGRGWPCEGSGETPALAIIACAAALEEGNE